MMRRLVAAALAAAALVVLAPAEPASACRPSRSHPHVCDDWPQRVRPAGGRAYQIPAQ